MKHLKIEDYKGYFLKDGGWSVITEMTKEDLLGLAHAVIEDEDFEMDSFIESSLPNPAQRIIYQQISGRLSELRCRREAFLEEIKNIYKDAYDKYCTID